MKALIKPNHVFVIARNRNRKQSGKRCFLGDVGLPRRYVPRNGVNQGLPLYPRIVLLTDFGHADPYLGQMKGVLLSHAPQVRAVDLCHEVLPYHISQAAFLLRSSHEYFPAQTIFLCVIDPGVGSSRALLAARWNGRTYLAPDNGLLGFLIPLGAQFWRLTVDMPGASGTFHGRDIFAPVAARLANGENVNTFGERIRPDMLCIVRETLSEITPAQVCTRVLHVDRFGNCLLDVPIAAMPKNIQVWSYNKQGVRLVQAYADLHSSEIGLLAGSQGVMELACNQSSCARLLGLVPGSHILLRSQGNTT